MYFNFLEYSLYVSDSFVRSVSAFEYFWFLPFFPENAEHAVIFPFSSAEEGFS